MQRVEHANAGGGAVGGHSAPDRVAVLRGRLLIGVKLAVSVGLLAWVLVEKLDAADAARRMAAIPPLPLGLAVACLLVSYAVITIRWQMILSALGQPLGFARAGTITWIGSFFNQALPSNVGGDFVRVWRVVRRGMPLGRAVSSVMLDRALTLVGLALLVLGCLPFSRALIGAGPAWYALPALTAIIVVGLVALLALDRVAMLLRRLLPVRLVGAATTLARDSRAVMRDRRGLVAIALSVTNFALCSAIVYFLARGLGIGVGFGPMLILLPPVMLVSLLPISFAGWGVREVAMATALGFVGVPDNQAVALSIAFGLLLLASTLPGGLLWFLTGNRRRAV